MYRVLLVDDEPWVIESYKRKIDWEHYGFTVAAQASDGFKALEIVRTAPPELIVSDIRMPGMNGVKLIRQVKAIRKEIAIIVMSGYAEFTYAQQAMNEGAAGYCLKPLNPTEFIGLLNRTWETLQASAGVSPVSRHEQAKDAAPDAGIGRQAMFGSILDFVRENYNRDITLQSVSRNFHLNLSYTSHLFKKETGVTFSQYVTELRMKLACELLAGSSLPIQEIAARAGYHDYFYFTKQFKRTMAMTPSAYRISVRD